MHMKSKDVQGSSPSIDDKQTLTISSGTKVPKYAPVALALILAGCGVQDRKVWVDGNGAHTSTCGQAGEGGTAGNGAGAEGGVGGQAGAGGEAGTGGQAGTGGEAGSGGAGSCAESGLDKCDAVCVDLDTDQNNCGECGTVCETALPFCTLGECTDGCQQGFSDCCVEESTEEVNMCDVAHACRDTENDASHCGGCGNACSGGEHCTNGHCE